MLAPEVVQYAPIVRVGETAVQKDDRRTVADRRVIKADAVDLVESYTAARGRTLRTIWPRYWEPPNFRGLRERTNGAA
jgi:hypothetical protein